MYGYFGTILKVNLSSGEIQREAFDEDFARTFLEAMVLLQKLFMILSRQILIRFRKTMLLCLPLVRLMGQQYGEAAEDKWHQFRHLPAILPILTSAAILPLC